MNDGVFIFNFCNSDDSDDELALGLQSCLMDEVGLVEGALCELTHEHQLEVKVCSSVDLHFSFSNCYSLEVFSH